MLLFIFLHISIIILFVKIMLKIILVVLVLLALADANAKGSCQVVNQNISVRYGQWDVQVNITVHGYYSKTDANKILYTLTKAQSGDCMHEVSYNMPAKTTDHTVVTTATATCVLKGKCITEDTTLIIDGSAKNKWSKSIDYNHSQCTGYVSLIVPKHSTQKSTGKNQLQNKHDKNSLTTQ